MNIEQEIAHLKERNLRVELDKGWETSWTRRVFIAIVTYVVAAVWLYIIDESNVALKAVVPTAGYILSTVSIPYLKRMWLGSRKLR
ncbi:MAG: hypothetical protein V4481_03570 [Patescibacteria group bacterium]